MTSIPRTLTIVAVLGGLAVAGCRDAPTEPAALVVAAETEAALRVAASLPALPQLVERARSAGSLQPGEAEAVAEACALWAEADSMRNAGAAAALRRRSYALAAPVLARSLGSAGLTEVEEGLRQWIELASTALDGVSVPGVADALNTARALLARAARADDPVRAAELLLEAGDRLRETTPTAVARRLIRHVEHALTTTEAPDDRAGLVARRRAERLLRGARQALSDGDPVLAIRRAYYARQLLGL